MRFVGLLVGVTVAAVAASEYQGSVVGDTMADLEQSTAAAAVLERSVLEASGPMAVVIYRVGDEVGAGDALVEYRAASARVDETFGAARSALHTDNERAALDAARDEWERIDPVVFGAGAEFTDEQLFGLLTQGQDPFLETIWEPLDTLDRHLTDLRFEMLSDMRAKAADVDSVRQMVVPSLLAALALALGFAYIGARHLRHRVLQPLEEIRRSARAMSDHGTVPNHDVRGAVTEIQEVAWALTEAAMSLNMTHGLLEEQAITDPLTALPNRKAFYDRIATLVESPAVGQVAVMFIDLDDFKDVNDTLGHAAGDKLLHIVGLRLQQATRGCEMVARLGGDEFAVALDVGDDPNGAAVAAQRILDTMAAPVHLQGAATRVGCSIGIALADPCVTADDIPDLLANADFAMYMAKSQGKNCYELHSPAMHFEMIARMELRRDLTEALDRDQFELHYQPIMDLDAERLLGFEALIRWNHPTRGLLPPGEFISMAEDTGAIVGIGAWVLETACAQLAVLSVDEPELLMSVNVAPQQLTTTGFAHTALNAVLCNGIAPDRLVLEITESTAISNTSVGVETLEELRGHGIHIALDDFGTGFASMRYLSDLPTDIIKIDRSFVTGRGDDESSMLDSIITLAHRLGLRVVAEGIETSDDLDRLRRYEQVAGQGFLFARPMPAHDIPGFRASLPYLHAGRLPSA